MSDIVTVIAKAQALLAKLGDVKVSLDGIQALVAALKAGSVTQAQIDQLDEAVSSASDAVDAVKGEEDAINPPAV